MKKGSHTTSCMKEYHFLIKIIVLLLVKKLT